MICDWLILDILCCIGTILTRVNGVKHALHEGVNCLAAGTVDSGFCIFVVFFQRFFSLVKKSYSERIVSGAPCSMRRMAFSCLPDMPSAPTTRKSC